MTNLYWKVKTYLEANGKTEDEFTNGNVILKKVTSIIIKIQDGGI